MLLFLSCMTLGIIENGHIKLYTMLVLEFIVTSSWRTINVKIGPATPGNRYSSTSQRKAKQRTTSLSSEHCKTVAASIHCDSITPAPKSFMTAGNGMVKTQTALLSCGVRQRPSCLHWDELEINTYTPSLSSCLSPPPPTWNKHSGFPWQTSQRQCCG